jgi:hypothetical protein
MLLMVATASRCQTFTQLRERLTLLQTPPQFTFDTTGFSSLPRIDYRCDNKNAHPSKYYHVVDLNRDGRKDLIYSGPCEKASHTAIFLNTGRSFKKIYENVGKLVSIDISDSSVKVHVFKEACCCDFFSQYTEVIVDDRSRVGRNTIVFGADTKISVASRFKKDKVMGTLRTTPVVNDVIKRNDCNNTVKGNQLTRIHDFKDIIQLNKAGGWWLVLYPETGERSWIGWMKLE